MSEKSRRRGQAAADHAEADTTPSANEELQRLLVKKETVEAALVTLEKQIYALETSYLEDTQHGGNLLKVGPFTWSPLRIHRDGTVIYRIGVHRAL